jgi:NADP-dependent 3-hydroxy acid dehydrogenase YdfG
MHRRVVHEQAKQLNLEALEMQRLTGKIAILTGASVRIARTTAMLFAKEGAKLVVAARRAAELESLRATRSTEIGHTAVFSIFGKHSVAAL